VKPITLRPYLALLALAALSPAPARGDMVNFSYAWSFGDTFLSAFGQGPISLNSSISPDGSAFTVDHGSGTATLTLAAPGTSSAATGDTPLSIPVGTLSVAASDKPAGNFSYSAAFNLTLRVTDTASGQFGDLTLAGAINGNVSPKGSDASAAGYALPGGQTVLLGGHTYTAGFITDPTDPISPGAAPVVFKVGLFIDAAGVPVVIPGDGGPKSQNAPEPSTLALGACALALCGLRLTRASRSAR
jgi:hypothetical protein